MQLDYVYLVYGFAFVFLAAILWPIVHHGRDRLPWKWVILFGLLHGVNEWMDLLALVLADSPWFQITRMGLLAASYVVLLEFGRRSLKVLGKSHTGAWIHLPLILLTLAGSCFDLDGLAASCRYTYGFLSGLLTGWGFLIASRHSEPQERILLRVMGWCWIAYACAAGLVVSPAPFFPARMLNTEVFLEHLGFHIQLLRAAVAITIAVCAWLLLAGRSELANQRMRWSIRIFGILALLLTGGYFFCSAVASHARQVVLSESETRFAWLADNLQRQTSQLLTMAKTMAGSPHIAPALPTPTEEALKHADSVLDRYAGGVHQSIAYLIDTNGLTVASSNRNATDSFVGKRFSFRPYFQRAMAGESSRYFALGVVSGERGLYCSAPVRSPVDRTILGVAVVKHSFAGNDTFFPAATNYVLLSPEGVVFLSGNPTWAFHTLYPISDQERERLLASKQFGTSILPPLFPALPAPGSDLYLGGERCCFLHKPVGDGWSVVMFEPLRMVSLYRLVAIFLVMLLGLVLLGSVMGLIHNALLSERNFREVFNSSKDAMFLHDTAGTIVDVNTTAREEFALRPTDVPGLHVGTISAENEGYTTEAGLARIRETLATGLTRFEWRSRKRTGESFWTEITLNRSQIGGKDRILAVVRDIDDRKKAEQALRDSEEHFRQLFENMSSGVVVCEPVSDGQDFVVRDINSAGQRLLSLRREESLHRNIRALFPESADEIQARFQDVMHSGQPQFLPAREHRHLETRKWIEHRIFRLPSGRIVCLSNDRTEIQALEERLRQSEKLCAIGQLAGGIAHDFNNQLTAVLGSADLLRMRLSDGRQRQFAELIVQAARRSRDLTNQLLAFARRGRYLAVPVDLHAIVDEVIGLAERSFPKQILLRQQRHAASATTMGDPTQLQNALLNLALNARDAMPNGGELRFESDLQDLTDPEVLNRYEGVSPGPYVRITVTDTGVGMSKETLDHLYEPFFTTKRVGEGTGLGLAAVYGTVKSHHGAIAVTSEMGRGTTFELLFPLVAQPGQHETPSAIPSGSANARVLVIDDDDIVCRTTGILLSELGCTSVVFTNGEEAVNYYRANWQTVDLVILDMIMPGLGGREVFLALKAVNPAIKSLLASGHSIDGEAQSIMDLGVTEFLQKPFELHELSQKLTVLLGGPLPRNPETLVDPP